MTFWTKIAGFILRNRYLVLIAIAIITGLLVTQIKYMRFSYTEANLLPEDHQANIQYNQFLDIFGEEGNLVILGVKDSTIFTPIKFNAWNKLVKELDSVKEVAFSVSIADVKELKADRKQRKFVLEPLFEKKPTTNEEVDKIKKQLFEKLPFYNNLLYNDKGTLQTAIYIDKAIVNTPARKDFITKRLIPTVEKFEKDHQIDVRMSGMPYIRTINSQNIIDEMQLFVLGALGITALIFFFFFRSFRATFITLLVVGIGVIWAFGFIGFFRYEITVLSALIPPLIIVIGVPNAVFLINKYQQEIKKHGNQAKSLQRVISKIGNATLMTNITTASGFATFVFVKSSLLREFGILASVNIISIFILALLIIPILYSFMPLPKEKHLNHLEKKWMENIVSWMERMVKEQRITIYITTVIVIILSMIGVYQIRVSGSLIEDMPKEAQFYKDIKFFETEFGGIMPLEILIDTKREKGVMKLSTLKKMEKLNEAIQTFPELSKPISITNLVKYSKQAYYKGNPKYYQLPTSQEKAHIFAFSKNSNTNTGMLNNFVDSTGRYTRITTFMKDVGTDKMDIIQGRLDAVIKKEFPKEKFTVSMTGKALVFLKGTNYLIKNLVISLSLAILLISIFMAWMFRSFKMIFISLVPNMLPLLITAGLMGFFSIPIKPSTILVFSIAFGISVDDTIHFLAKYRQELLANNWKIKPAVYAALQETGVSMFYTSIVLFFGFLVFTISSFGGTIALGGLVSVTLLLAMVSNLILLPSLLLSFENKIANKKVLKETNFKILPPKEETNK
ncbi:efflux RND transporter permease subunit [Tenacibaculum dicentrarchi]|uniref:efflux RND transporter permease subunit n=1 Tax=Tenacibaculum dicentrarchi TaxID=669041 RepID=UPI000C7E2674|nr:efflux RND transporter permease subunit [Tenacibaculum dicentrarchi]MCD8407957.1 efflux RND transporter permease subunit [Tenacibaculum dicentrarchi]MCD8415197.1 efflux RND transporter permease subunit [Tenacibaculum dicentrarchi]MCD8420304.1 efflux RND transporter permease subunit [Tenacibaculum dicentrarchi]MCD8425340.1 efflux RND transporter permease subunit [Tenacibaculum dicentrarchi]